MVGVELMDLGMHFDSFGSLYAPIPGLPTFLGIGIALVKEGLDIALIIDG